MQQVFALSVLLWTGQQVRRQSLTKAFGFALSDHFKLAAGVPLEQGVEKECKTCAKFKDRDSQRQVQFKGALLVFEGGRV